MSELQTKYFNFLLKNLHPGGTSLQGLSYISYILANYEIGKTKMMDIYEKTGKEYGTTPTACERCVRRWFEKVDLDVLRTITGVRDLSDIRGVSIIPILKATIEL